jgi:Flp pilus assembly protein TadG
MSIDDKKTLQPSLRDCSGRSEKAGFMARIGRKIRDFGKQTDGAAAVEFVIIVPIMLSLYFGTMEMSQAVEVNKKAGRASSLIADLVTQQTTINSAELVGIADIAVATLHPYERSYPVVEIVGIQITDEKKPRALVAWSKKMSYARAPNSGIKSTSSSFLAKGSEIVIPRELLIRNTFIVRGGLRLNYYPVTSYTMTSTVAGRRKDSVIGIGMGENYHMRPRNSPTVKCTDC